MCKNDSIKKQSEMLRKLEKKCDECVSMHIECGVYTPCAKCEIYMKIVNQRKQCGIVI